MDRNSIDLKSIYCKGLKSFNLFQKPSIYAVVSIRDQSNQKQQQQKTPPDPTGGEKPEWDHPMRFDLDGRNQDGLILEFKLMVQGNVLLLGDKVVGKSRVPITDLTAEFAGAVRHVSYQVRTPNDKPNGVISFSYKINYPEVKIPPFPSPTPDVDYYPVPYPAPDPSISFPAPASAGDYYPPPSPPSDPAVYYPSARPPPPPDPSVFYPSAPPAVEYFPTPYPAVYYPDPEPAFRYYPTPAVGGYYPPPPPAYETYYPPPSCYPPPPDPYGYRPESRGHGLYGYY